MIAPYRVRLARNLTKTWHAGGVEAEKLRDLLIEKARRYAREEGADEVMLSVTDDDGVQLIHQTYEV